MKEGTEEGRGERERRRGEKERGRGGEEDQGIGGEGRGGLSRRSLAYLQPREGVDAQ